MTIHELTPAHDAGAIVRMTRRFLASSIYGDFLGDVHEDRILGLARLLEAQGVIFGAEVAGYFVGMIGLLAVEHPLAGWRYASELAWWVDREHRTGRVGPELLKAAEAWALRKGCTVLHMVAPSGSRIGRYYEAHGYTALETNFVKSLKG